MENSLITWPAIIKYSDDNELNFLSDLSEWNGDADLHYFEYDPSDILIDSAGVIHHLNQRDNGLIIPTSTGEIIDLKAAIAMVQAHFSAMGSCCSAKLSARSVAELIELVAMAHDNF